MERIVTLLIILINSFSLISQDTKLTVVDSLSGEPIAYANISLSENSGTYTNENGVFFLAHKSPIHISHVGYKTKTIKSPINNPVIKLIPQEYFLDEILISPKNKCIQIGYLKHKSKFIITGFSGDEIAVLFHNQLGAEKKINALKIGFSSKKIIKKYFDIDFVSVFRINFYSNNKNSKEPGKLIYVKNMEFTSDIIKKKETIIDLSDQNLYLPIEGIFISIEWIGIQSNYSKKLITNYKERVEPFLSTTFEKTNATVFERNRFSNKKWQLIDKNNKYSIMLKENNFYTPRISLSVF
jgi:hypothetical protein